MELGARLAQAPYVAVTGTNGKTTTTGMIGACLRASGLDAIECGNIGRSFPRAAREGHDVLVVEVSSFQLATQESFHPKVSVLLNVAPDHLDWHGSYDAYVDAKALVHANQAGGDHHVGNRDDASAAVSKQATCPVTWFRLGAPSEGEVGYENGELVARLGATERLGRIQPRRTGYLANAAAAAAAALAFGVPPDAVTSGLSGYEPPSHRGEVVAAVAGVRFIDDSKATNVHAAVAAIGSVERAVLIAGGRAKGQDLSALGTVAERLVGVVAIGESAEDVVRAFEGKVQVAREDTLEQAVRAAFWMASEGDAVLLAPACASWDMFTDYTERGERFAEAARLLAGEVNGARA
jgi:UDP-N-acetylmuramoylalanine--D-glutamate ligase